MTKMMCTLKALLLILSVSMVSGFASFKASTMVRKTSLSMANIIDTAKSAGNFNTLVKAIEAAGLTSVLSGPGPFTVFAPTDEAFARLPKGNMEALMNDIPTLQNLLKFHVHPGKMSPTRNGKSIDTLMISEDDNPKQLTIKVTNWTCESFIMTGQENYAQVTTYDVKCDNGVIHIINEVLIPYKGNHPPKITFIGARDMTKEATLQQGYYGSRAGEDRFGNRYTGPEQEFVPIPVGEDWKVAGNWAQDKKN